jgi:hypothetical protein
LDEAWNLALHKRPERTGLETPVHLRVAPIHGWERWRIRRAWLPQLLLSPSSPSFPVKVLLADATVPDARNRDRYKS